MIRLNDVMGQAAALEMLSRMLEGGRIPHALLFHGPEGIGKASVATAFAASLLCESPDPDACGRCPSCMQVGALTHPDFLLIKRLPQKSDPSKLSALIVVDQIRELLRVAAMAPRRAARRLFLIDPADRMNQESQNTLLKTLEEPPGAAVIILVAARSHLLLPTVRSRCFAIPFGPLRVSELEQLLVKRGLPSDEAAARAALAEGRPGRALSLDLPALLERRGKIIEALDRLTSGASGIGEIPLIGRELAGKNEESLLEALELLEALMRDVARAGLPAAGEELVHADLGDRLRRLAGNIDPHRAAAIIGCIESLRAGLRFNLNRTMVADALLAAIAGGPLPR